VIDGAIMAKKMRKTNDAPSKAKFAWITGAGTGIGEAAAIALACEGMTIFLTGRRVEPLKAVAARIAAVGGRAFVRAADVTSATAVCNIAHAIRSEVGQLDVLVNNAGLNVPDRHWQNLNSEGIDTVIRGNLTGAFYVAQAVLPIMRAQGGGLMIHVASWAGRFIDTIPGPAYLAAKHGVVAMSHSINLGECINGIRSCVLCPQAVATPLLAKRSQPELPDALARMIQPDDMGNLIAFIARQPSHICVNEVVISPTFNRGYIEAMQQQRQTQQQ
jgi:NADP-dependent 3-hydroxy acid dehydrogenase YdfG